MSQHSIILSVNLLVKNKKWW